MAINEWWVTAPEQRYWMEITDRADLGADLFAPTAKANGQPYWGYELLTYVQPGDVVLHWHQSLAGEPAMVGSSIAAGAYEETDIEWQAHGTAGRTQGSPRARPAWRMPLSSFALFASPTVIEEVRKYEEGLRQVQVQLQQEHPAGALYFPFQFSAKRALRVQQTYLVKMPMQALELLGMNDVFERGEALPVKTGQAAKNEGSGYIADSAVRSAIEMHAVQLAIDAYDAKHYSVEYTGASKPYDLEVAAASDLRRVEVKGSSGAAATVELTSGEVMSSRGPIPTDLFVVDGIQWTRGRDGSVRATGGRIRWWRGWTADEERLAPTRFRYTLPPGGN